MNITTKPCDKMVIPTAKEAEMTCEHSSEDDDVDLFVGNYRSRLEDPNPVKFLPMCLVDGHGESLAKEELLTLKK